MSQPPAAVAAKEPQHKGTWDINYLWLALGLIAMAIIWIMPTPDGLSVAGQRAVGILAFAVIVWVTEAVSYPVSALMIAGMIALGLGYAPPPDPEVTENIGTNAGLRQAMNGLSTPANTLVLMALFLAAAMQVTNLHRRLALIVLKAVGQKTNAVLMGAILVATILAFFVPSATARAGAVIPILLGMVAAFGLPKESRMGALMVITAVHAVSIWNVGIKTAAAQNLVGIGFIQDTFGEDVAWARWFMIAAPWSIIMCVVLFFVMKAVIRPEVDELEGGDAVVQKQLDEMGPISLNEKKLIGYSLALLFFWATEKVQIPFTDSGRVIHTIDSSTITLVAIALMLTPAIGVFTWKQAEPMIAWGTIIVFGIGISLGTVLLNSGGAAWLSDSTFGQLGLDRYPLVGIIAIVALFNILIHLGFASATSLASALMPVFIALTFTLSMDQDTSIGFALIQQFVISFGFLLPISSPQGMLAYGTGTFQIKDYFKAGVPLTIVGYLLVLLFSATYWQWIGVI